MCTKNHLGKKTQDSNHMGLGLNLTSAFPGVSLWVNHPTSLNLSYFTGKMQNISP